MTTLDTVSPAQTQNTVLLVEELRSQGFPCDWEYRISQLIQYDPMVDILVGLVRLSEQKVLDRCALERCVIEVCRDKARRDVPDDEVSLFALTNAMVVIAQQLGLGHWLGRQWCAGSAAKALAAAPLSVSYARIGIDIYRFYLDSTYVEFIENRYGLQLL